MIEAAAAMRWRLMLARACAWSLLVAGWIGIGSFALLVAPSLSAGFALVALWLLGLGGAAAVATRGSLRPAAQRAALCAGAAATMAGLWWTTHSGGWEALLLALIGWASLTALASGVVRSLRIAQALAPRPPIVPATLGAAGAALALGDIGDLQALAVRLMVFIAGVSLALFLLQARVGPGAARQGCRAGLFDCSLPSWPAGAWRDVLQWPTLIAGLVMLPMMAALPLMAEWCRAEAVAPRTMVLWHLAAMFGPALVLRRWIAHWSARVLSSVCAALLVAGAVAALWAASPANLLGVSVAQGAAWGIAWCGQLWAPQRRGRQGASPLVASVGYAVLTIVFGVLVELAGARGVILMHASLGFVAALAWLLADAGRLLSKARGDRIAMTPGALDKP
ncbi:MAG TPA: hypothetical protein VFV84_01515 [Burkholderiales bacterium]|nr:hypothetical protein [Burkholderiales bacterium]